MSNLFKFYIFLYSNIDTTLQQGNAVLLYEIFNKGFVNAKHIIRI